MVVRSPLKVGFVDDENGHDPVAFRLAYFGVGLGGKTSNLLALARLAGDATTDVSWATPFETESPRTIWYDKLTAALPHEGQTKPLQAYSIPGNVGNLNAWTLLLHGIAPHGIVFVVDSQIERTEANLAMAELLIQIVSDLHRPCDVVVQYNKRDLLNAADTRSLSKVLNPQRVPEIEAVACQSRGVMETVQTIRNLSNK